jgi:hypothetical protein
MKHRHTASDNSSHFQGSVLEIHADTSALSEIAYFGRT